MNMKNNIESFVVITTDEYDARRKLPLRLPPRHTLVNDDHAPAFVYVCTTIAHEIDACAAITTTTQRASRMRDALTQHLNRTCDVLELAPADRAAYIDEITDVYDDMQNNNDSEYDSDAEYHVTIDDDCNTHVLVRIA